MKKILTSAVMLCLALSLFSCKEKECAHLHLTSSIVEPTCGTEGYTLNTCTECKSEFKTKYVLPLGHTVTEEVVAPTCAKEGYTEYKCPCGYGYKANDLPPSGHIYNVENVTATCEQAGYIEYTCTVCSYSYKNNFVDALGHKLTSVTVLPTRDSVGYTEYTCESCKSTYQSNFVFYSDMFGSGETQSTAVLSQGIDVSVYQHMMRADGSYRGLNWTGLKNAGVDYAILKAGSGKGKDPVFEMNYADARAAGMDIGAYFYCYATTEEALETEIEMFLSYLEGKQFEYPVYFDLENSDLEKPENKELLTKFCIKFIDALRDNGYYGALYVNTNWMKNYLYGGTLRQYCDIWLAQYPSNENISLKDTFTWSTEKNGAQLGMWQYSQKGFITDCNIPKNQAVDLNYCYKDYPSIIKKFGLNGFDANIPL